MRLRALLLPFFLTLPIGCLNAAEQRAVTGVGNAAACAWLAANVATCGDSPEERLATLSAMQRAEVEALLARAVQVDPAAVKVAVVALEAGTAGLRAVTEQLTALAAKAPPAPAAAPPPAVPGAP